jgi:hypothetical protein
MVSSVKGKRGEDTRRLAEAFQFLLSDTSVPSPSSQLRSGEDTDLPDLQRLLSIARQDQGQDVDLHKRRSNGIGNRLRMDKQGIESSREAVLILDENRLVLCASAQARNIFRLGQDTSAQIFNYFFKPGKPALIHIERQDRTVGVGRLLASNIRWGGKAAYLVTVRDVTRRQRDRVAAQRLSRF